MDYQFLSQTMLFSGESPEEIKEMLSCLGAVTRSYGKGEIIYHAGECVHSMGLVLSGNVQIESDDVWGNHSVLDDITPGFFFAETYASLSKEPLMVNVVSAAAKTEVLFLNIGRLLTTCTNSCTHHNRLIHNLFFISARKNLLLSRRIFHTTPKSIRGRLLSYLSAQSAAANSLDFTIPFNRQQLADYLNVDHIFLSNSFATGISKPALSNPKSNPPHPLNKLIIFIRIFSFIVFSALLLILIDIYFSTSSHPNL